MKQNRPPGEVALLHLPNRLQCTPGLQEKETQVHQYGNTLDAGWARPAGFTNTQYRSAAALFRAAVVMRVASRSLCAAAKSLDAWLERRRIAAAALRDLAAMSERELLDIGLTRSDVHRVAWGASDRYRP
jgi:uncharacterized protein YjiS (DUF1127 family)